MEQPYPDLVAGFEYRSDDGNGHDGEVVHIVARVQDRRVLDDYGPCFFVRWENTEVGLVPGSQLSPWFQL